MTRRYYPLLIKKIVALIRPEAAMMPLYPSGRTTTPVGFNPRIVTFCKK